MSSTDATTTDGFRVGRRVRVIGEKDPLRGTEATIVPWYQTGEKPSGCQLIRRTFNGMEVLRAERDLELLPDDEPDAPATPKPRFKPKDRVSSIAGSYKGWYGTVIATNGSGYHVVFDCGPNAWKPASELDACAAPEATPEPAPADDRPAYYAKLREAGCEPFAVIRGCMPAEKAVAYHQGTAIAYLIRAEHKHDSPDDDIRKAHAHLGEAVAILDGRKG